MQEPSFNFTFENSWKSRTRNGTDDKSLAPFFVAVFSLVVAGVATLLGNSLLLYTLCRSRKLSQNVTNIFVFSLACTDVLCALITTPFDSAVIVSSSVTDQSVLGTTVCNVFGFAVYTLHGVSIHTMTLTSVNRYFCVGQPIIYKKLFRRRNSVIYAVLVWVLAVISATTSFFGAKIEFFFFTDVKMACFPRFAHKDAAAYGIFLLFFYVIFPFLVMFVFYFKIFLKLQQHNAAVRPTLRARVHGPVSMSSNGGHFCGGPSGESPHCEGTSQAKEEVNITKVLVAIPLAFCVCYLPVCVTGSLYIAGWRSFGDYFPMYFMLPVALNKALNPFILLTLSKTFRSETLKLLRRNPGP